MTPNGEPYTPERSEIESITGMSQAMTRRYLRFAAQKRRSALQRPPSGG